MSMFCGSGNFVGGDEPGAGRTRLERSFAGRQLARMKTGSPGHCLIHAAYPNHVLKRVFFLDVSRRLAAIDYQQFSLIVELLGTRGPYQRCAMVRRPLSGNLTKIIGYLGTSRPPGRLRFASATWRGR